MTPRWRGTASPQTMPDGSSESRSKSKIPSRRSPAAGRSPAASPRILTDHVIVPLWRDETIRQ